MSSYFSCVRIGLDQNSTQIVSKGTTYNLSLKILKVGMDQRFRINIIGFFFIFRSRIHKSDTLPRQEPGKMNNVSKTQNFT